MVKPAQLRKRLTERAYYFRDFIRVNPSVSKDKDVVTPPSNRELRDFIRNATTPFTSFGKGETRRRGSDTVAAADSPTSPKANAAPTTSLPY